MIEPLTHPLRAWRLRQVPKMTLDAAAAGVGTVRSTWHDWETGRRKPEQHIARLYVFTHGEITADSFYFPHGYPDLDTPELAFPPAPVPLFEGEGKDETAAAEPQLQDIAA